MITVSVCMIVKNEQEVLKRCLDSLRPIADEIVIVDTGSVDGTKEIAAEYTDKIYDFVWCDDFSAARNFAFSKATMEYIYSADADEVLDEENCRAFLELKKNMLPEIEIVQFWYTNQLAFNTTYNYDEELRPKLYKRLRSFVWVDPLHEYVRREPVIYDSGIKIIHRPVSAHGNRDFRIFKKEIERNGGLSKKLRSMYSRELFIAGNGQDFQDAAGYFKTVLERPDTGTDEMKAILCVLARAALYKETDAFFKAVLKCFVLGEPPAEICCMLGQHYEAAEDFEEASVWYYNAAFETEPELNIEYGRKLPLEGLVRCKRALRDEPSAQVYEEELRNLI